jgi:hypothetical protein
MLAKSTAPNHGAGQGDEWQNLRLKNQDVGEEGERGWRGRTKG